MRRGFILRATGTSSWFFDRMTPRDKEPRYVEHRDYAWFTQDRTLADQVVADLAAKGFEFEVVEHSHECRPVADVLKAWRGL